VRAALSFILPSGLGLSARSRGVLIISSLWCQSHLYLVPSSVQHSKNIHPSLQHQYLLNPPSQRRISPKANHSPNIALLLSLLSLLLSLLFSFHLSNLSSTAMYAYIWFSLNFSQPFLIPFVSFVQPRCSQFFFCPPCVFSGCCSPRFPPSWW